MSKLFQDLLAAMKMLGLNPMEQEIIDLTNNIVRNGYIYFPEFCKEGVQILSSSFTLIMRENISIKVVINEIHKRKGF